mmetsp:Transcript_138820/g.255361  ORF Transcript_138820/g.255361 Transcript_138820/m.255361 type:complete len:220 (-) Transcript_138820:9-668(-)
MASSEIFRDPADQWAWHEAYRDLTKNMYRTSYSDMTHGREVAVKSDFPAGYQGHVPSTRFDLLFRNTRQDRDMVMRKADPFRESFPCFKKQLQGVPSYTKSTAGARKNSTYKVVPHHGTTSSPIPPYATTQPVREPPSFRTEPATLRRMTQSAPSFFPSRTGGVTDASTAASSGRPGSAASSGRSLRNWADDIQTIRPSSASWSPPHGSSLKKHLLHCS